MMMKGNCHDMLFFCTWFSMYPGIGVCYEREASANGVGFPLVIGGENGTGWIAGWNGMNRTYGTKREGQGFMKAQSYISYDTLTHD